MSEYKTIIMSKKDILILLIGLIAISLFFGALTIYLFNPSPSGDKTLGQIFGVFSMLLGLALIINYLRKQINDILRGGKKVW